MSALLLAWFLSGADSKYIIKDPAAPQRVDYLVVAGDSFVDRLDELAAYREKQGYAVGIVAASAAQKQFGGIREFLANAVQKWKKPAPTYLLLVGDVDTVPTTLRDSEHQGFLADPQLATDFEYACPLQELEPLLHVGRFPCDTPEELAVMIRKTIDYETKLEPGAWQKRVDFLAGMAGFGATADAAIEKLFAQIVTNAVPPGYDVEVAYANPKSPYCPFPPKFNDNAFRMANDGSLLYVFVGHGSVDGVQTLHWSDKFYPIFKSDHAPKFDVRAGLPVMVVIACSTGHVDGESDCVGEVFFKQPKGPIAFLGGSRVTDPYGNALLGRELAVELLGESKTVGEGLTRAKAALVKHEKNKFNDQMDMMATMMGMKGETFKPVRRDTVRHYNLFGDPALVLQRPASSVKLALEGNRVSLAAEVPELTLTLECARDKFVKAPEKIEKSDPEFEKKVDERYRTSNNKVLRSWTVKLKDGKGSQEIELPQDAGKYYLKASAPGRFGFLEYTVTPPKEK